MLLPDQQALDDHYITQNGYGFNTVPFKPVLIANLVVYPKPRTLCAERDVSDKLTWITRQGREMFNVCPFHQGGNQNDCASEAYVVFAFSSRWTPVFNRLL